MEKKRLIFLFLISMGTAPCVCAQPFWQKKDYQKWSQSECRKLLTESPWSSSYTIGQAIFQTVAEESAVPGRDTAPQITYQVQFWSARPIRAAMVRIQQLDPKYAKLSPEQKKVLDEQSQKFLNTDFHDTVVAQVMYSTTSQAYDAQLARYWQSTSVESLKQATWLIGAAGRVAPLSIKVAPGAAREMQLVFPRQVNGKPLIGPGDKNLALELEHPAIGVVPGERVFIRFDAKKMLVGGNPVY